MGKIRMGELTMKEMSGLTMEEKTGPFHRHQLLHHRRPFPPPLKGLHPIHHTSLGSERHQTKTFILPRQLFHHWEESAVGELTKGGTQKGRLGMMTKTPSVLTSTPLVKGHSNQVLHPTTSTTKVRVIGPIPKNQRNKKSPWLLRPDVTPPLGVGNPPANMDLTYPLKRQMDSTLPNRLCPEGFLTTKGDGIQTELVNWTLDHQGIGTSKHHQERWVFTLPWKKSS